MNSFVSHIPKGRNLFWCFLLLAFVFALDQFTKAWSEKAFLIYASADNIRDFSSRSLNLFRWGSSSWLELSLTYTRNTGAAWGLFGQLPEVIRPIFFYLVTPLAIFIILSFFIKSGVKNFLAYLGIVLLLAGALANYFDRVFLHYVIDWIHVSWKIFGWFYDFPVFNVADSAVSIGVCCLMLEGLWRKE